MKATLLQTILPEGFCGVANWSIGVYKIDWQPGVKYYGGILVDGEPPVPCAGMGEWYTSLKPARASALAQVEAQE